jgi:hypothetical protein
MPLPPFNDVGDLPAGVHAATMDEIDARFGTATVRRQNVMRDLRRIYALAHSTGELDRLIVFGSFVSDKPEPNDVDVVLVMRDTFRPTNCPAGAAPLFDHLGAEQRFGASVFWVRPGMLIHETLDQFIGHWQIKRDRTRRGIVEVRL